MASNIKLQLQNQIIVVEVKGYYQLCTVNYNLYLPSHSQVIAVPSHETVENVKSILQGKRPMCAGVAPFGSHKRDFVQGQDSGLIESYDTQFKQLKSSSSKCVSLADRMTAKGTKLVCYVSAFANYSGGNIYYGVDDQGKVQGEIIKNKDENTIVKKIDKTISKMVWLGHEGKPKKGRHWDVYFEPVKDTMGNLIESTFVVVVGVTQCRQGVFAEEPESYHVSEGKVTPMTLQTWTEKLMGGKLPKETRDGEELYLRRETENYDILPNESSNLGSNTVSRSLGRCNWSSATQKEKYRSLDGILNWTINEGLWKDFNRRAKVEERKCTEVEGGLKLVILSMKITADYKNGKVDKAEKGLADHNSRLNSSKDRDVGEVMELLVRSSLERCKGNHGKSYEIASNGLAIVDRIPAEIFVAKYYANFASVITTLLSLKCDSQTRSSLKQRAISAFTIALEHLRDVRELREYPPSKVDQEQKVHINLAFLYLGCSFTGDVLEERVDTKDISKAVSSLRVVDEHAYDGYALSNYRKCQYLLAHSALDYRRSQYVKMNEFDDRKSRCLNSTLKHSSEAKEIAHKCNFDEMLLSSRKYIAIFTEKVLILHVARRPKINQ